MYRLTIVTMYTLQRLEHSVKLQQDNELDMSDTFFHIHLPQSVCENL